MVLDHHESLNATLDGEVEIRRLRYEDADDADVPSAFDRTDAGELLRHCAGALQRASHRLARVFSPNVGTPAMPHPYVVDVLVLDKPSASRARRFKFERATGNRSPAPDNAKVALLHAATPERGFVRTEALKCYKRDGANADVRAWASRTAEVAYASAREHGVDLLVLPEVFLPEASVARLVERIREDGRDAVTVVAGVEYATDDNHDPLNRAVVLLTGRQKPLWQTKKYPSVYETGPDRFATDDKLLLVQASPVGVMGVVICSDYLEADLLWQLANCRERIDTLIVVARNPQPQAFERLAEADALRLYAHVIIVNSYQSGTELSGRGTVVAAPLRASSTEEHPNARPLLEGTHFALGLDPLDDGWPPSIEIFDLDLAAIRHRDDRRDGDRVWLPSPTFAKWRRSNA